MTPRPCKRLKKKEKRAPCVLQSNEVHQPRFKPQRNGQQGGVTVVRPQDQIPDNLQFSLVRIIACDHGTYIACDHGTCILGRLLREDSEIRKQYLVCETMFSTRRAFTCSKTRSPTESGSLFSEYLRPFGARCLADPFLFSTGVGRSFYGVVTFEQKQQKRDFQIHNIDVASEKMALFFINRIRN